MSSRGLTAALVVGLILTGPSCEHSSEVPIVFHNADNRNSVSVGVGREFDVALDAIGPAYFVAPPVVSSTAVEFLAESDYAAQPTPAGYMTQTFKFRAVRAGEAEISIARDSRVFTVSGFSLTVRVY